MPVTSELLELLPVPPERDLPPGRVEVRTAALVAAIEAEPAAARSRLRSWLTSLGVFLASLAVVCSVLLAGSARPHETELAAKTVVVLAGGTGAAALAVAPRPFQPALR
jgi:hypothetical protein